MSNDKQQTAVDWYANRLCDIEIAYNQGVIDTEVYAKSKIHALEQAKEMEKQQITKAWKAGDGKHDKVADELAEQWYEKTYGGNK